MQFPLKICGKMFLQKKSKKVFKLSYKLRVSLTDFLTEYSMSRSHIQEIIPISLLANQRYLSGH